MDFQGVQNIKNTLCNAIYHLDIWLSEVKFLFSQSEVSSAKIFLIVKFILSVKKKNFIHLNLSALFD